MLKLNTFVKFTFLIHVLAFLSSGGASYGQRLQGCESYPTYSTRNLSDMEVAKVLYRDLYDDIVFDTTKLNRIYNGLKILYNFEPRFQLFEPNQYTYGSLLSILVDECELDSLRLNKLLPVDKDIDSVLSTYDYVLCDSYLGASGYNPRAKEYVNSRLSRRKYFTSKEVNARAVRKLILQLATVYEHLPSTCIEIILPPTSELTLEIHGSELEFSISQGVARAKIEGKHAHWLHRSLEADHFPYTPNELDSLYGEWDED